MYVFHIILCLFWWSYQRISGIIPVNSLKTVLDTLQLLNIYFTVSYIWERSCYYTYRCSSFYFITIILRWLFCMQNVVLNPIFKGMLTKIICCLNYLHILCTMKLYYLKKIELFNVSKLVIYVVKLYSMTNKIINIFIPNFACSLPNVCLKV